MAEIRKSAMAAEDNVARQAAREVWTPAELLASLRSGTDEDRLQAAIDAGILDEDGNVTPMYSRGWGNKVTRTMGYEGLV